MLRVIIAAGLILTASAAHAALLRMEPREVWTAVDGDTWWFDEVGYMGGETADGVGIDGDFRFVMDAGEIVSVYLSVREIDGGMLLQADGAPASSSWSRADWMGTFQMTLDDFTGSLATQYDAVSLKVVLSIFDEFGMPKEFSPAFPGYLEVDRLNVPLPASLWLLASALGFMGLSRYLFCRLRRLFRGAIRVAFVRSPSCTARSRTARRPACRVEPVCGIASIATHPSGC